MAEQQEQQGTPVVRSFHEYEEFLSENLALVRCLLHLGRGHRYLKSLDERMSACWRSSVNASVPSAEQRRAAKFDRVTARRLKPVVWPHVRTLAPRLIALQDYADMIPVPEAASEAWAVLTCPAERCGAENPADARYCRRCGAALPAREHGEGSGWSLPNGFLHGDDIIAQLGDAIDDVRCLKRLARGDAMFDDVFDQLMVMARWTRESLNPPPPERAQVRFGRARVDELEAQLESHLAAALARTADSLHAFNHLYVNFPTTRFG